MSLFSILCDPLVKGTQSPDKMPTRGTFRKLRPDQALQRARARDPISSRLLQMKVIEASDVDKVKLASVSANISLH